MSSLICIVPFRSGSKGFPHKNFKSYLGEELWLRAVKQGLRVADEVIASTDFTAYEKTTLQRVTYDERPAALAQDDTQMSAVITYLIKKYDLIEDIILLLQPTSPLRTDDMINCAMETFLSHSASMVFSVVEQDNKAMKYGTINDEGFFSSITHPMNCFKNRQELPKVFIPNGAIYIFSAKCFLRHNGFPTEKIATIEMDAENSLDIDTEKNYDDLLTR